MSFVKSVIRRIRDAALTTQIILVLTAFGILVYTSYNFVNAVEQERRAGHVQSALNHTQTLIEADLDRTESMVTGLAFSVRDMIIRDYSLPQILEHFKEFTNYAVKADVPGFLQFFGYFEAFGNRLLDGYGEQIHTDSINVQERPWYVAAVSANGNSIFTDPYLTIDSSETIISCVRRVFDENGKPLGIVGMNIGFKKINKYIGDLGLKQFKNSRGILTDGNSTIIAHPDSNLINKKLIDFMAGAEGRDELKNIVSILKQTGKLESVELINHKNEPLIVFFQTMKKHRWKLGILIPEKSYSSHTRGIVWFFLGINALVLSVLCYTLMRLSRAKRKGDEFTRLVFDKVPLACALWDNERTITMCNDAALRLFGVATKQDFITRFYDFSPEYQPCGKLSRTLATEKIDQAYANGMNCFEWMHKTLDGKPLPCYITLACVKYKNAPAIMSYMRDVREEKAIHEKLREAEEHMKSIYDMAPLSITTWDTTGSLIDCNMEAIKTFEVKDRDELFGNFIKMAPDYQSDGKTSVEKLTNILAKTFKEGYCRVNWDHMTAKGEPLPFDMTLVRIRHKEGYIAVAYARDMREINAAMRKAREADERAMMMLDAAPVGVTMWDRESNLLDFNLEAARVVGINSKSEYREKFISTAPEFQPDGKSTQEKLVEFISKIINDGHARTLWHHKHLNGETIPFDAQGFRIKYRDDDVALVYCTDLREAHRAEIAEENNKAKSRFLATMSHEIRTPMNVILGVTDIQLQDDTLPPHLREAFTQIYNSSDVLLGVINDILDLSKIEAGRMEFTPSRYSLTSMVNDTAHLNMMRNSKPIEFELDISEEAPIHLYGDELRIKQILNNLLSNAFKFTNKGVVKLHVEVQSGALAPNTDDKNGYDTVDNDVTLIIKVCDTGQGMTKEQVNRLFSEYTRFNLDTNRTIEGTGLGMSITQRLISMMGGQISVVSEPNVGTTVSVRLPQKRMGDEKVGKELAKNLREFRVNTTINLKRTQLTRDYMPYGSVLIVDDVESNLYVAKGLMASYGLNIDTASCGLHAIEKIKAGKMYDIIFMDHMMPNMDGIETTKVIRELGYTLPIVALTANAVVGQSDIFLSNGFDDFISKPIDIRQLNAILNRLVRDKQPPHILERAKQARNFVLSSLPLHESPNADTELLSAFARDAVKTLPIIESVSNDAANASDEDLSLFTINTHAMKSALANIGESRLSQVAQTLEKAGKAHDRKTITLQTPSFIKALKGLIDKAKNECDLNVHAETDEDPRFLKERLAAIAIACMEYDDRAINAALTALKNMSWTAETKEILNTISDLLLHSNFEEAAEIAARAAKRVKVH